MKIATQLNQDSVRAAVAGGAILGGGGGGSREMGSRLGQLAAAAGDIYLTPPGQVPPDCTAITCSLVGAPGAAAACVTPRDFLRSVQILSEQLELNREEVVLITNENGATATLNGWWQAAALGIRLADIPCNGRAHPLGIMGAMGLHRKADYRSHQTAVGGDAADDRYCETYVQGSLAAASRVIRGTAEAGGGLVAVARNPVEAGWAKKHGAPGAIAQALQLGAAWLAADTAQKRIEAVKNTIGGHVAGRGRLRDVHLTTSGGFDVGTAAAESPDGDIHLEVLNEYLTLRGPDGVSASFPDLICLFDDEGQPLGSAEISGRIGDLVHVVVVPQDELILGAGAKNPAHWTECRRLLDDLSDSEK